MPRLGCDIHLEKPLMEIADRVFDLRNRVKWLKNVEYCLLGDQNRRITKIKTERHNIELLNDNLRKKMNKSSDKIYFDRSEENQMIVENIECLHYKRNQVIQERNQLIFIQKSLEDRLQSLRDQIAERSQSASVKPIRDDKKTTSHIRKIRDRLSNVKLIQQILKTCKQHLQCDLDLLQKELPNIEKDIQQKYSQKQILQKELTNILDENQRYLKGYQQLVEHTETQSRQRHALHEQAMASVAEQLEDQYQVQTIAVNDMTSSIESRKFNGGTTSTTNRQPNRITLMNSNEILEVRCMYDQFYKIIMTGYPIDINNFEQIKINPNEISARITAMLTMINRMIEEKEEINQQINRTDQLLKQIDMSMNAKKDTRQKIFDTMIKQRQELELFYINDTIEDQNRIVRQINDFLLVLSNVLAKHISRQFIDEPSTDLIERLQYLSNLIIKTTTTLQTEPVDNDDRQTSSPIHRRTFSEENSQISIEPSINSSLSSLTSRRKRNSMKNKFY